MGESSTHPLDYYDNNVNGTLVLLRAMHNLAIHKLVFSSSATVYGTPQYLPYDEKHPTAAMNPYGRTKLMAEEILADLAHPGLQMEHGCAALFQPHRGTPKRLDR